MKRLLISFAIMLFASAAATTAWGEASEQETKDFIVSTINKCAPQFNLGTPSNRTYEALSSKFDGTTFVFTQKVTDSKPGYSGNSFKSTFHIPLDKVGSVSANEQGWTYLTLTCLGSEGDCVYNPNGRDAVARINSCPVTTNAVLVKAFTHLIGIYKAQRPKPLFEVD